MAATTYYHRTATSSTARHCDQGTTLREHVFVGGDALGSWQSLALACTKDKNHAVWVLISSVTCVVETPDDLRCIDLYANGVPPIVDGDELNPSLIAPSISYSLVKFVVGFDCTVVAHYTQSPTSFDDPAWKCQTRRTYDGTLDSYGRPVTDLADITVHRFTTYAPEAAQIDSDLTPEEELLPIGMWNGSAAHLDMRKLFSIASGIKWLPVLF